MTTTNKAGIIIWIPFCEASIFVVSIIGKRIFSFVVLKVGYEIAIALFLKLRKGLVCFSEDDFVNVLRVSQTTVIFEIQNGKRQTLLSCS